MNQSPPRVRTYGLQIPAEQLKLKAGDAVEVHLIQASLPDEWLPAKIIAVNTHGLDTFTAELCKGDWPGQPGINRGVFSISDRHRSWR